MTGDDHEPTEYANTTNAVLPNKTVNLDDLGKYIQGKPMAEFQEEFEVSNINFKIDLIQLTYINNTTATSIAKEPHNL